MLDVLLLDLLAENERGGRLGHGCGGLVIGSRYGLSRAHRHAMQKKRRSYGFSSGYTGSRSRVTMLGGPRQQEQFQTAVVYRIIDNALDIVSRGIEVGRFVRANDL